ncbi:substrate-binding periplasmic protein [Chitinibacteraceae bacterium HSL-7]
MSRLCLWLFALLGVQASAETITLNAEDDWAPYSYVSEADRQVIQGFAPEVIRAALATQDIEVRFNPVPFSRCLHETLGGKALGCFDIEINSDNAAQYHFHHTPLFLEGLSIFAAKPSTRRLGVADLREQRVGATRGYTYPPEILNDAAIVKDVSPSDEVQLKKLLAGRIDYALINTTPARLMLKAHPEWAGRIHDVGLVNEAKFYVGFSRRHPDGARMAQALERGLLAIHANGSYARLKRAFQRRLE